MSSLRAQREAVVRRHMDSENRHEFDVTLATFEHPRYEIGVHGLTHCAPGRRPPLEFDRVGAARTRGRLRRARALFRDAEVATATA